MPATRTDKWSSWLIIGFFFFILLSSALISSVALRPETNIFIPLRVALAFAVICALASMVTGLIAIIRHKEQAVSVFLAAAIGSYFLFFIVGFYSLIK
jgi:hypothetical protein